MLFRQLLNLRRLMSGDVLKRSDILLGDGLGKVRLQAKQERHTGDLYVTLSVTSAGHADYLYLSTEQFAELATAVRDTDLALKEAQARQKRLTG